MTESEMSEMLLMLQAHSAIGRLNLAECREVFRVLETKGYTLTPPAQAHGSVDPNMLSSYNAGGNRTDG